MRTRNTSKRPAQELPDKSEDAAKAKAISPKPRDKRKGKLDVGLDHGTSVKAYGTDEDAKECAPVKEDGEGEHEGGAQTEMDWEDGDIPAMEGFAHELGKEVTVEFTDSPSSAEKRTSRRVSPEEKELAEVVHKVHLLCLLARGRMVDKACNDPLIQASVLSLLPSNLLKITETPNLTVDNLKPLVNWFHSNFQISTESVDKGSFESNVRFALQNQKGTAEEVAALSVVLFRALNLTARFVCILDVASLKPDGGNRESHRLDTKAISSPITNAPSTSLLNTKIDSCSTPRRNKRYKKESAPTSEKSDGCAEEPKRKGDIEFEMQLQMALSATATATKATVHDSSSPAESSGVQRKLRGKSAIWSRSGPPLYWAEVYCSGETLNGRWIHVDAVNGIVDGEDKIEAAAAVCKRPLRYAIAFAGNGAKDVTRRYCLQWYKIAPSRVNVQWWDKVMAPLTELESIATGLGSINKDNAASNPAVGDEQLIGPGNHSHLDHISCSSNRSTLEDMELETRALTEPLPTNQLAYKNHHLYAIEKWLTKNQTLYPRGPVLGYCSGNPVYPRSCVQILQTRQKWLREGLQVRANQLPAKVVKQSKKVVNAELSETSICDGEEQSEANSELYGKWQLEPLQLRHAENGIVPKNEHGNVEVWSEKCIPPGTVHLRLPRLVPVAKRLEIDFAPALVGFEFRNARTYPVFEGIIICSEFKDAILEAYSEEEERREAAEKKRDEAQALNRWFQLLSSIATRQRLKNSYAGPSCVSPLKEKLSSGKSGMDGNFKDEVKRPTIMISADGHEHEHVFPVEDQIFDEETAVRTKRCPCGFSIQVEEL
ncbi:DNA repair protein complementing XP-C cells [Rhynchospora pubera]|uniref:DNA repair protein complementing XP-C cells n=1 Tax=Rhynchospora pubera TaxID=906938 RepID=A0AAV8CZS8_9POAL|nr:DNA repair protein complementing XP-C cells [Rhynchospora pubera]